MAVSDQVVLLMSIGPVQDMIASARKCRDLWFGSWLLAEVAKSAAIAIAEAAEERGMSAGGCDALVFPGASTRGMLDRERGVANRIVARLPGSVDDAERVAVGAALAARQRLEELAREAFNQASGSHGVARYFMRDRAARELVVAEL